MNIIKYITTVIWAILLCTLSAANAEEMSSDNFRIPTSVVSGGGTPMNSNNFKIEATMGQPSPLMDPLDPPYSADYDLYPGFWYTAITEDIEPCECDLNTDGGCDMLDYFIFGQDWGRMDCNDPGVDCECDLNSDGGCDMLDYFIFGQDWGRMDCP